MEIILRDITKRYLKSLIFKNVSLSISEGQKIAVLGSNGSGKSTLLKIISGIESPSSGNIEHYFNNQKITPENLYRHIAVCTPYMELFEELTLRQSIDFHFQMKPALPEVSIEQIAELLLLENELEKEVSEFSSGMKQRLKLGLAILSDTPLLLLDEPTINLDKSGVEWYLNMINQFAKHKTIVVCSNQMKDEYSFCTATINIEDFKLQN